MPRISQEQQLLGRLIEMTQSGAIVWKDKIKPNPDSNFVGQHSRVVLEIECAGKHWTLTVTVDDGLRSIVVNDPDVLTLINVILTVNEKRILRGKARENYMRKVMNWLDR